MGIARLSARVQVDVVGEHQVVLAHGRALKGGERQLSQWPGTGLAGARAAVEQGHVVVARGTAWRRLARGEQGAPGVRPQQQARGVEQFGVQVQVRRRVGQLEGEGDYPACVVSGVAVATDVEGGDAPGQDVDVNAVGCHILIGIQEVVLVDARAGLRRADDSLSGAAVVDRGLGGVVSVQRVVVRGVGALRAGLRGEAVGGGDDRAAVVDEPVGIVVGHVRPARRLTIDVAHHIGCGVHVQLHGVHAVRGAQMAGLSRIGYAHIATGDERRQSNQSC